MEFTKTKYYHALLKLGFDLLTIYWAVFKVTSVGVRVLIENEGQVLLIKHTYRNGFYFPGGGVRRGEDFAQACKREVFEEIGLVIDKLQLVSVYRNFLENKNNCVLIYRCGKVVNPDELKPDGVEVAEAIWVDPANPPKEASYYTKQALDSLV
jgi:ADP-ribose pyrophosphatase YjhB (NUDIX family)